MFYDFLFGRTYPQGIANGSDDKHNGSSLSHLRGKKEVRPHRISHLLHRAASILQAEGEERASTCDEIEGITLIITGHCEMISRVTMMGLQITRGEDCLFRLPGGSAPVINHAIIIDRLPVLSP